MSINEIAGELFIEMSEPSDVTAAIITFWMRGNIGQLNNIIASSFTIDGTNGYITPVIDDNAKAIFKKLYEIKYLDKKIKDILSLAATNSVLEVSDVNGGTIRLINKNEMAKTYAELRKNLVAEVQSMAGDYRMNGATPLVVNGADTIPGFYQGANYPFIQYRFPNP